MILQESASSGAKTRARTLPAAPAANTPTRPGPAFNNNNVTPVRVSERVSTAGIFKALQPKANLTMAMEQRAAAGNGRAIIWAAASTSISYAYPPAGSSMAEHLSMDA